MSKITQRKKRVGGKRKRGGTLKRKKSSAVLSDNMPVDKKPKVVMGLQLDLGKAEEVRAEINREHDDKLFLQEKYNKNIQKLDDNKEKKLYLSPLTDKSKHTSHDQIKRTPQKMYEDWKAEEEIGEYADASIDGLTDSALKPLHKKSTYYDETPIKLQQPKNLFKGGIREVNKKCSRKSRSKKCLRKSRSKKRIKKYTKKRKVGSGPKSQKLIELNNLILQQIRSKLSSSLTIPLKDNESFPDKSLIRAFSSIYKKNKDEFDSYTGDDIVTIYRKWRQHEASDRLNLRDIERSATKPTKIMATKRKSEQRIYNEMLKSIKDDEIMDKGLESQFSYIHEPSSPMKTIPDLEETPWSSTRIDKTNIKSLDHERELLEKVSSTNLFAPRKSRRVNLTNNNEQPNIIRNNLFSTNTNLDDLKDYDNINPNVNMYNDNIANDIDNELASELFDEISNSKISHKK